MKSSNEPTKTTASCSWNLSANFGFPHYISAFEDLIEIETRSQSTSRELLEPLFSDVDLALSGAGIDVFETMRGRINEVEIG